MSFFEDYVEEGSHCASCCQFIGADVGYIRYCRSCEKDQAPAKKLKPLRSTDQNVIVGLTKTQRRREQAKRSKARKAKEAEQS